MSDTEHGDNNGNRTANKPAPVFLSGLSLVRKLHILLAVFLVSYLLFLITLATYLVNGVLYSSQEQLSRVGGMIRSELVSTLRLQHLLVEQLARDTDLWRFVDTDYSYRTDAFEPEQAKTDIKLQQIARYLPGSQLHIYNRNRTIRSANAFLWTLDDIRSASWYRSDSTGQGARMHWQMGDFRGSGEPTLICYQPVFDSSAPYDLKMVVAIGFAESRLTSILRAAGDGTQALLYDEFQARLARSAPGIEADLQAGTGSRIVRLARSSDDDSRPNGTALYFQTQVAIHQPELGIHQWRLFLLSPVRDTLVRAGSGVVIWLVLSLLLLLLLMLLTVRINRNIISGSQRILSHIEAIVAQDYRLYETVQGRDEFARISRRLNHLAGQLAHLIETNYKAKIQIDQAEIEHQRMLLKNREAEIVALQNQINPHYFYNTLETIRMHLMLSGDDRNAEMIQFFAESLRTYDKSPQDRVMLADELVFLKKFIDLQNYRFHGQIQFVWEVAPELESWLIPHFLLQPLIENSIRHGFRGGLRSFRIGIRITAEDDALLIVVRDNGAGMSSDQIDQIRKLMDDDQSFTPGPSVGLVNISRRLRLLDPRNRIDLIPGEGSGLAVQVRIQRMQAIPPANDAKDRLFLPGSDA